MTTPPPRLARMEPLKHAQTEMLDIAYHESGPSSGDAVVLLHGFPYDIHSYRDVSPLLAAAGHRVIVPYLRGHGPTRFQRENADRSGQQAALGADVVEFMDALNIPRATLAGYDWGGRAACVVAALWPERVTGLVSVNSYQIQDISKAMNPLPPKIEAGFWYFYYFLTERGRAALAADPKGIADVIWRRNSPAWAFDQDTIDLTAEAFANPDYVDVVIHSYRHRLAHAPGAVTYDAIERQLAQTPPITVPTITLEGLADGNFPPSTGLPDEQHFTGPRSHRRVELAGHNLPQEAPGAFARAVLDVMELAAMTGTGRER